MSSDLKWSDITNIQWSSHTKFLVYLEESFPLFNCPWTKKGSLHNFGSFLLLYCSPICRPQFPFTILAPWKQRVQRRATKFILNNYVSNCRLCSLDLNFLYTTIEGPLYSVLRKVFERKKNALFKAWKKQKLTFL